MSADSDGDGIRNLFEYFHGMDPTRAQGPPPVVIESLADGWLQSRYWRNPIATDVTSRVIWTTNLVAGPWSDEGVVTEVLNGEWQNWHRVRVPVGQNENGRFLRLEVAE
jgi:hypothetical protein